MSFRYAGLALFALLLLCCQACNVGKYIPAKKYLLDKNEIVGAPKENREQMYSLLKQTPNKKIIGLFRINMWSYLWFNTPEDVAYRLKMAEEWRKKLTAAQEELAKTPQDDSKKRKKLEGDIAKAEKKIDYYVNREEDLKKSVWEEPVILDSNSIMASASQLKDYLFDKGYFYDTVTWKVKPYGKKAKVVYSVKPGKPFFIHRLDYYVFDKHIYDIVAADSGNRLLNPGQQYNGDNFRDERTRLTMLLREHGYYSFRRDYIYFDIDSFQKGNYVNAGIGIANPANHIRHRVYRIGDIYVEPEYQINDTTHKDTILYKDLEIISQKPKVKPSILSDFIFFHSGDVYKASDYQATIVRLSQLNTFKSIDIQYTEDTTERSDTGILTVFIRCSPFPAQAINLGVEFNSLEESQAQITTTRSLGSEANMIYQNKNLGSSALQLEVRPQGSVELPISIFQNKKAIDTPAYQYGITNTLIIPRLLVPWRLKEEVQKRTATTSFNLNYIVESSKYFKRSTGSANMTYQENLNKNLRLFVTPLEISYVNTSFINDTFYKRVQATHNPLLINLFDQHLITDFRAALLFNQQPLTNVKSPAWYLRLSGETGGNVPALIDNYISKEERGASAATGKIFGINYYQYTKFEADFRYYIPVLKENNFAFRFISGIGAPNSLSGFFFPNTRSTILPFEKQFYVGGANSIRAWKLRTLGPGSYSDPSDILNYDKSGDIKLEMNGELRFPIYSILKMALFADAGNVWLYNEDPKRPGAAFHDTSFYKEIAVGTGIGFRFDFDYFVIRLDFGIPLRDPSLPEGHRWLSDFGVMERGMQLNLGIGYPF